MLAAETGEHTNELEGCSDTFAACDESCQALLLGECGTDFNYAFECRVEFGFACEDGVALPSTAAQCEVEERYLRQCLEE